MHSNDSFHCRDPRRCAVWAKRNERWSRRPTQPEINRWLSILRRSVSVGNIGALSQNQDLWTVVILWTFHSLIEFGLGRCVKSTAFIYILKVFIFHLVLVAVKKNWTRKNMKNAVLRDFFLLWLMMQQCVGAGPGRTWEFSVASWLEQDPVQEPLVIGPGPCLRGQGRARWSRTSKGLLDPSCDRSISLTCHPVCSWPALDGPSEALGPQPMPGEPAVRTHRKLEPYWCRCWSWSWTWLEGIALKKGS